MAQQPLPEYKRTEAIQAPGSTPEFGEATRELAKNEYSTLSAIGAKVAQTASTALAQKWGYEMGQTPKGDLFPPITDFDKQVTQSYNAQAQATLGNRANQMLFDTANEVNTASRITPDLIASSHQQMAQGLDQILKEAPTAIKTDLGYTFANQLMQQTHNFQTKMISQDRTDKADSILANASTNKDLVYQMQVSGNKDGADKLIKSSNDMVDSGPKDNLFSQQQAIVTKKSIVQAGINGQYIHEALNARNDQTFEEWADKFAKTSAEDLGITEDQKEQAAHAVISYMGTLDHMKDQKESLLEAKLNTAIVEDVTGVTGTMLQHYKDNVSRIRYEQGYQKYLQAFKANGKKTASVNLLSANWNKPEYFSRESAETINSTYTNKVAYAIDPQNSKHPPSVEDAEVQVAATAAGVVPVFLKTIETQALSANPNEIKSAAYKIQKLRDMEAGRALFGMDKRADAIISQFQTLSGGIPEDEAARQATHNITNIKEDTQKVLDNVWNLNIQQKVGTGFGRHASLVDYALSVVNLNKSNFLNASMATLYGTDLLTEFHSNFDVSQGDLSAATTMTNNYFKQNYGETRVNGAPHITEHPLEKVLGYQSPDVVPYIHQDLVNQLEPRFKDGQEAYFKKDEKTGKFLADTYWTTKPVNRQKVGIIHEIYDPVTIERHTRIEGKNGKPDTEEFESYPVVLIGGPSQSWDVSLSTKDGMRNIFQVAPYLGVISYVPNKPYIDEEYNKDHVPGITKSGEPESKDNEYKSLQDYLSRSDSINVQTLGDTSFKESDIAPVVEAAGTAIKQGLEKTAVTMMGAMVSPAFAGTEETVSKEPSNKNLTLKEDGYDFIRKHESKNGIPNLNAYKDIAGFWTIGYGHKLGTSDSKYSKMSISKTEAENLLKKDAVERTNIVKKLVKVPLNQNQLHALVSLVFNIGEGGAAKEGFKQSTLLKKINNGASADEIKKAFKMWNKATIKGVKRVSQGLINRRQDEIDLYFKKGNR